MLHKLQLLELTNIDVKSILAQIILINFRIHVETSPILFLLYGPTNRSKKILFIDELAY